MSDDVFLFYVTVSSYDEGLHIAQTVVDEDLAACANLLPSATSLYKWEGSVRKETEHVLLLKTSSANKELLTARVVDLHSYETPCVVGWPLACGDAKFLEWVKTQTSLR